MHCKIRGAAVYKIIAWESGREIYRGAFPARCDVHPYVTTDGKLLLIARTRAHTWRVKYDRDNSSPVSSRARKQSSEGE